MKNNKKVGIILVNYNGLNDTLECIESIKSSTYKYFNIYVVDNNSSECSDELSKIECVTYIKLDKNVGFGIANNIAAEYAEKDNVDLLLCLNNDTIIDKNMIELLVNNTCDNVITTCAMYYYSNKNELWYGGGEVSKIKGNFRHKQYKNTRYISFLTGCCFMMTINAYKKIGLFDDAYFMYYEDSDFSLKAQKNGIKLLYIYEAKLWHKVGKSINKNVGKKDYYLTRNRLYVLNKYKDFFYPTATIYFLITRSVYFIKGILKHQNLKPVIDGIKDFKSKSMGISERTYR